MYASSLAAENAINYSPYLNAANAAGIDYSNLANIANAQMGRYAQGANAMQGAQGAILNRAFDPNMVQYNMAANDLTGQVNAQQAARGLGNSPVGAMELGNTLGNFNTNWNASMLQNELAGIQGAGMANKSAGEDLAAMLASGQAGAGYRQQGGQIPIAAQQYVAGMPAANAASYVNNMGNLSQMYGQQAGLAIPYLTGGQGAQQFNTAFNAQQNAAGMNALMQGLNGGGANGPGAWLSNLFSGSGGYPSGQASLSNSDQSAIWDANAAAGYGYGGV